MIVGAVTDHATDSSTVRSIGSSAAPCTGPPGTPSGAYAAGPGCSAAHPPSASTRQTGDNNVLNAPRRTGM